MNGIPFEKPASTNYGNERELEVFNSKPYKHLPDKVYLRIFSFFELRSLSQTVSPVCRKFNEISEHNELWNMQPAKTHAVILRMPFLTIAKKCKAYFKYQGMVDLLMKNKNLKAWIDNSLNGREDTFCKAFPWANDIVGKPLEEQVGIITTKLKTHIVDGRSPLFESLIHNGSNYEDQVQLLKIVLKLGVNPNESISTRERRGRMDMKKAPPIFVIIDYQLFHPSEDYTDSLKLLIQYGVDFKILNEKGQNALEFLQSQVLDVYKNFFSTWWVPKYFRREIMKGHKKILEILRDKFPQHKEMSLENGQSPKFLRQDEHKSENSE